MPTNGAPADAGYRHRIRVVIGERHRTIADALQKVVHESGVAEVAATAAKPMHVIDSAKRVEPDVAIVDLELSPTCSLISALHTLLPSTRIVALADHSTEPRLMLQAVESGAVGVIYRSSSLDELTRALTVSTRATPVMPGEATGLLLSLHLEALQEKRQRDIATVEALAAAVEARDAVTADHLDRVTELATACMRQIDESFALNEELTYGFMLHDIGKIGVPDAILNKPGSLDEREWEAMRQHPEIGVRIVDPLGFPSTTTDVILCHHERWDGRGYPNGIGGDDIPLSARAFAIADGFDAMTSDRPYRAAMTQDEALSIVRSESGKAYDPDLVEIFLDVLV